MHKSLKLLFIVLLLGTYSLHSQVLLVSPNGGETWINSTTETVVFNNSGLADYFEIQISIDGGISYYSIDFVYAFSGTFSTVVDVSFPVTTAAKIKVINYSNTNIADESDGTFTIENPSLLILRPEYLEFNYQNLPILVSWLRADPATIVDIALSLDNGVTWQTVGENIDDTAYTFIAPPQSSSNARVKLTNIADTLDFAVSDQFYIFPEPSVTLISPNGGETWNYWDLYATVAWSGENLTSYVNFYFTIDDGISWIYMGSEYSSPSGGTADIEIPYISDNNVKLKVVDGSGIYDESDDPFTIFIAPLNLVYPTPNYTYYAGGTMNIAWYAFGPDLVTIELSTDSGTSFVPVAQNVNASQQLYYYQIPQNVFAEQCVVKIFDQNDPLVFDVSEIFEILPAPVITITYPDGGEMLNTNTPYELQWTYDNMIYSYTNLFVEFSPDNGNTWQYLGSIYQYGQINSFDWVTPSFESDSCLIRVTDAYLYDVFDLSDSVFAIKNIPETPICMVSVDQESGKNFVIWEPVQSPLIAEYVIFKETNQANVYEEIGAVPDDASTVFIDYNSTPMIQANRYKLGIRDAAGNGYPLSEFHQTIHLTISPGIGNSWNLVWSPYLGFEVQSYNIYRGYDTGDMEIIATISGNLTSYTDFGATGAELYYMVEVISPDACDPQLPQAGIMNFNSTTSNIASNVLTSQPDNSPEQNLMIYPNPATQAFTISNTKHFDGTARVDIFNNTGTPVKSFVIGFDDSGQSEWFDVSDLTDGVYMVKIGNQSIRQQLKLIISNNIRR